MVGAGVDGAKVVARGGCGRVGALGERGPGGGRLVTIGFKM